MVSETVVDKVPVFGVTQKTTVSPAMIGQLPIPLPVQQVFGAWSAVQVELDPIGQFKIPDASAALQIPDCKVTCPHAHAGEIDTHAISTSKESSSRRIIYTRSFNA